jgi:hypothetical protein
MLLNCWVSNWIPLSTNQCYCYDNMLLVIVEVYFEILSQELSWQTDENQKKTISAGANNFSSWRAGANSLSSWRASEPIATLPFHSRKTRLWGSSHGCKAIAIIIQERSLFSPWSTVLRRYHHSICRSSNIIIYFIISNFVVSSRINL